ncbi:MAG: GGDEF domain-containing protein [Candidatus Sumerlaeia bacterium]|nr:GGDEF domain-containing protein [Candidatus Sumerlaeia bacterium]
MQIRKRFWNYVRNSVRFRVLFCTLISVVAGSAISWLSVAILTRASSISLSEDARLGLLFFMTLLFTLLLLLAQVSIIIQPISRLNRRLRQLRSAKEMRTVDSSDFAELAPLLEAAADILEWAENQQNLSAAIHHAFRKRIAQLAEYDSLTGLYNRYYLKTILPLQIAHMINIKDQLSAIMVDVDHFKHYNDTHGHPQGDRVLTQVADILRRSVRDQDICCRYGGEEFFIALPNANLERALVIANRIRTAIAQTPFPHGEQQPEGRLTVSLGVACFPMHARLADDLIECADRALYLAKRSGRDRICTYNDVLEAAKADSTVLKAPLKDVPPPDSMSQDPDNQEGGS